ncbi:polysaccharide deacetylase family protein [Thermomonospora catenispora]|uniref:polysaccharide deacetylase family protein n=1 Tax=Thermomonospora catenispora TaxID=2493090 RepID=UPI0011239F18|nr:polysaccharide deacetylase family protein [Thermomonospora catenispora]TNY37940.1 polysaccharide deacetylase family protein [Thermomonospora catenispora]
MFQRSARTPLILVYRAVDRITRNAARDADRDAVPDAARDLLRQTVGPALFERQMDWLHRNGLRGVSVSELRQAHRAGRARGLVGLTFDCGYATFATRAAPVLLRRGFTATVFVPAARIGGHEDRDAGGGRPLLTERQIRCVAGKGMEIGSHGLHHVPLSDLEEEELVDELSRARALLEEITGRSVTGFAYPWGQVSSREVTAVRKAGYEYACTIGRTPFDGDHALPRTRIGPRDGRVGLRVKVLRHQLRL